MSSAKATPAVTDVYRGSIDANLERWRRLFQELIQLPSHFEGEQQIVEKVAAYIDALGVELHRVAHVTDTLRELPAAQHPLSDKAGRSSLVARLPGKGGGRSLVINTHLDIVPAGDPSSWTFPPFSGHIDTENNVIYGRGAMDDKAGVTASLAILETLSGSEHALSGDVIFQYVLEDEITGNGSLLCLEAGFGADAALIMDGTRMDKAINQHAGQLQFEVELKGKPASVSVSHMGVNAAEMIARLLIDLRDHVFSLNGQRVAPWTKFPSPYQLIIQRIESEGAQLTVPESATARCYVTFPPTHSLATMRQFITEHIELFAQAHDLSVLPQVKWNGFATEPVQADTHELEAALKETADGLGLEAIEVGPSTGTSDMRHFAAAGIPCLLYGPGNGHNPHRPDEHYYLDDLPRIILFYLSFANAWCGNSARV